MDTISKSSLSNRCVMAKQGYVVARSVARLLVTVCISFSCQVAMGVDWSTVPSKQILLFHPGQSSVEWTARMRYHTAAKRIQKGKHCRSCHEEEESDIGRLIASGEKLEPEPHPGKRSVIPLWVQIVHDSTDLYIKLKWAVSKQDIDLNMDVDFANKLTLMIDDGRVSRSDQMGCWVVCHDDLHKMPRAPADDEPIGKYHYASRNSRTRDGSGRDIKPENELDELFANGQFMEYWQARFNPGSPAIAVDGYILETWHQNEQPLVSVSSTVEGNQIIVVLSRPLVTGLPQHKDIVQGKTYTLGFAIHEAHASGRFHNVSFEHSLVLGDGSADFQVSRQ